MFGATGTLFSIVKRAQNDWKVSRIDLAVAPRTGSSSCETWADCAATSLQSRCLGHDDDGAGQEINRIGKRTEREFAIYFSRE